VIAGVVVEVASVGAAATVGTVVAEVGRLVEEELGAADLCEDEHPARETIATANRANHDFRIRTG